MTVEKKIWIRPSFEMLKHNGIQSGNGDVTIEKSVIRTRFIGSNCTYYKTCSTITNTFVIDDNGSLTQLLVNPGAAPCCS